MVLRLAGFILEDTWGRVLYPIFYLVAGAAALQFYRWCAHGSFTPLIGASGAVAALMGAFLVRFPKMKIEMMFFTIFYRRRFKAAAYWLLPLWLAMEFFYGSAFGTSSPVAHWAHLGGFLFGMAGAFALQQSGLEQKANEAIESKLSWSGDPEVVRASEAMEQNKLDEAAAILQKHVAANPNSADALNLLQQVHWRRSDIQAYQQVTIQFISRIRTWMPPGVPLRNITMPAGTRCPWQPGWRSSAPSKRSSISIAPFPNTSGLLKLTPQKNNRCWRYWRRDVCA